MYTFMPLFFRRVLWLALLPGLFALEAFSQKQAKVLVTDVIQEIKLYHSWRSVLNEESFPDGFTKDTLWTSQLKGKIEKMVLQKTGAAQVQFLQREPIKFIFSAHGGFPALQLNQANKPQADYFVAIVGQINVLTISLEKANTPAKNYHFTLSVQIKSSKDSLLFANKVIVPFSTIIKEGYMHGMAELSKEDFQQLYERALQAAFERKEGKLAKQVYYRPPLNDVKLNKFIANADLFLLQEKVNNGLPVRKGEAKNSEIILKDLGRKKEYMLTLQQNFIGNTGSLTGKHITNATLTNPLTETNYSITASFQQEKAEEPASDFHNTPPDPILFIRCMTRGLLVGNFTMTSKNFEGLIGYEVYNIYPILPKNTFEVRVNNKLQAIAQKSPASSTATENTYFYFSKEATDMEKGTLVMVFQLYKLGHEFGKDYFSF